MEVVNNLVEMKEEARKDKETRWAEKEERKRLRAEKKEERRKEREDRKQNRESEKRSRTENKDTEEGFSEIKQKVDINLPWPEDCDQLFLDGNNMLFALNSIRKLVLSRKSVMAETILKEMAIEFASKMNLNHCTLIYDETKLKVEQGEKFSLCCARPAMKTSDDALVAMAAAKNINSNAKWIFVTSDRELIQRLTAYPNIVMWKPKQWFSFVARTLSGDEKLYVETWADSFVNDRVQN